MKIFDAHCDTALKLYDYTGSLLKNNFNCDISRMREYEHFSQFFAICIEPPCCSLEAFARADGVIDNFIAEVAANGDYIRLCTCFDDIVGARTDGKIAALLTLEGGSPLGGELVKLDYFIQKGVRLITLTWNYKNELGCGAVDAPLYAKVERGLTAFGIDVVRRMNERGIVVDVSHLSDEGFYDVLKYSAKPFMASHSNTRAVCNHPRNLTDDMIKCIGAVNGFIGVNLYPKFIGEGATVDKLIGHIEHICSLIGPGNIGLGCDFDGTDNMFPSDIHDVTDINKIVNRLVCLNYPTEFIEKFTHVNLLAYLRLIY